VPASKPPSTTITYRPRPDLRLEDYREIPGGNYGTPKEAWSFCLPGTSGTPAEVGLRVLSANADILGLEDVCLQHRHAKPSCGGWHVIFSQQHLKRRIHRAYVTVHMNRSHEVYLIKNRAVPVKGLPGRVGKAITQERARQIARRSPSAATSRRLSSNTTSYGSRFEAACGRPTNSESAPGVRCTSGSSTSMRLPAASSRSTTTLRRSSDAPASSIRIRWSPSATGGRS
jgi:hypothetical protein